MLGILEEHFEELDFLWEQRERVIFAGDWTLRNLTHLDERVEAHLDGLRIGGEHSVKIARPQLASDDTTATAAAFTLLAMGSAPLAGEVLGAAVDALPPTRERIRIALRHSDPLLSTDRLYELSIGGDPGLRALAADVLAFHRLRPPPEVERLLDLADVTVLRLGYAAAGRFGRMTATNLKKAVASDDAALRQVALEAAARCGVPDLVPLCREEARRGGRAVPEAVAFLGVVGELDDVAGLRVALGDSALAPFALAGMGSLGNVAAIPLILEMMAQPASAEAAAAAFVRITGADKIRAGVSAAAVGEGVHAEQEGAEDGPSPDPARASAVWNEIAPKFAPSQRWQDGIDISTTPFAIAQDTLSLASRRDMYLRMRAKDPKAPDLELEAFRRSRP
jgi:uncharacterized protein (TIGR02270 family)